jgi:hypothetical protein
VVEEFEGMMVIDSFSEENRFLSNFHPCEIEIDGMVYHSVENAYQATKTLNVVERKEISQMTPGQAKRKGSKVLLRDGWESIKLGIMEDLIRQKFNIPDLKEKLILTGDAELIEGNDWGDRYWGMCEGEGQNVLGKILMKIRTEMNPNIPNIVRDEIDREIIRDLRLAEANKLG